MTGIAKMPIIEALKIKHLELSLMAKKKNTRKKKKSPKIVQLKIKPSKYIRLHARKSPVHKCLIDENWRETQFSPVIVSRKKASGRFIAAVYIVDLKCLGVKNSSYYHDLRLDEYEGMVEQMENGMHQNFVEIDPALCFNIIYGAVEFAEDCGFQPHKDFEVSEFILDDVETVEYMDVPLGKDGKPFFVSGPFDDTAKIMATLAKNKGAGNFDYLAEITSQEHIFEKGTDVFDESLSIAFPKALIDKKIASLTRKGQEVLHLQLNTAATVMKMGNFDVDYIKEEYENNDDFFEDIVDEIILQLEATPENLATLTMKDEGEESVENHAAWIVEKIIEFGGPQFLWSDDFEPELTLPSYIDLENLSEEEWEAVEKKKQFYMTEAQKQRFILSKAFLNHTSSYSDEQLKSKATQATVVEEFLKDMQERVFKERWTAELNTYCQSIAEEALEKLESTFK